MSLAELTTAAALIAVVALAGYYLLARPPRPPGAVRLEAGAPFTAHQQQPYVPGPDGHPLPQWGFLDAIAVVIVVVAGTLASGLLAYALLAVIKGLAPGFDPQTFADTPEGGASFHVLQWAVTVGLPLLYLRGRGYRFDRATFGFRPTRAGYALGIWMAVMVACYVVIPAIYISIIEHYRLFELPEQEVVQPFGLTWGGFVIAVIVVTIATPVIEEFFFRGIIHQGLARRLGFFAGAVISSAIFALAHYPYWGLMPILFSYGFGFAVMLRATGSLWPSIVGHFAVNISSVLVNFGDLFKN